MYTGSYGLVCFFDKLTEYGARTYVAPSASNDDPLDRATFIARLFHLTLYHACLEDMPRYRVEKILEALSDLRGQTVEFDQVAEYGDKFLFWDAVRSEQLRAAHQTSLDLACFMDRIALRHATREGLRMSREELANLDRFGHPLVGSLYRPHITLAYDERGFAGSRALGRFHHVATIERVAFVTIGTYGAVERIVM